MKKIFLFLFIFTTACAPQVTATRFAEVTVTALPATSTPTPIPVSPTPEQPADTGLSPEQIAANMAEWNAEFTDKERKWYQVTADGRFVAVNKDGSTQDVPNFRYDEQLNVLWQLKPSVYLNRDIWVPITMGDTRPERKQDANGNTVLTGNINFPACAFDRSTLTCRAETVWFNGEKVETISKAEAMLILHTWMQEIYQATLARDGQAAAEAVLLENSDIRAESVPRLDAYMTVRKSNGKSSVVFPDGAVWDVYPSGRIRWGLNSLYLTDKNGKFEVEIPTPFYVLASGVDNQNGVISATNPNSEKERLFVNASGLSMFNPDEYDRTHLTVMQMSRELWFALTSH